MDKAIQDNKELRDEELYALLDKAWETDRLCVSEELIQKTLKRAAEETESKVISFETAKKRKLSPMKYVGVAVAAVFVAVLGLNVFGNGGFFRNDTKMEATADNAERRTESAGAYDGSGANAVKANRGDANGDMWYSSQSETTQDMLADMPDASEARRPDEEIREESEESGMSAMTVTLSRELTDALDAVGATPVSGVAECWEFATGETDWEKELLNSLRAAEIFGKELPYSGTYRYVLQCNDGTQKVLEYREPLDQIVRIETKQGSLWGMFGETGSFVME